MRNTITALILFTLLVLTLITQPVFAEQTNAQNKSSAEGRIVHFPKDRSMGTLYIQDEGIINIRTIFGIWSDAPEDPWQILCPAQGNIVVPPGKRLSLWMYKKEWKDLSPLKNLKPNDLYELCITGDFTAITNPNDTCMPHIAHLTGLKDLSLKSTNISTKGLQYIKDFHSLEYLYLPTRIDDSTLTFISQFKSLKGLYFSRTGQVTNEGLAALQQLPNLEEMYFDGKTKINTRCLRQLSKIPSLERLSFFGEKYTDDGLIYLRDMPQLKTLMLNNTKITDSGLQFFSNLHQLQDLSLFNTQVTDAGVPHLVKLKSLRRLNLQTHPLNKTRDLLTDKSMHHIAQLPNLECLELNRGCLTDFTASEIAKLPKLKFLDASSSKKNPLTNAGFRNLAKIKSLEYLYTDSTYITSEGIAALAQLPNLKTLRISCGSNVTKKDLVNLTALKQLSSLSLGSCKYKLSDLTCFNEMPNLKSLGLRGVIQDGSGLDISGLKNLESLYLGLRRTRTSRSDAKPKQNISFQDIDLQCLKNLTHLKQLFLGPNHDITDKGLMYLKGLTDLETLDLSDANLTDDGLAYLKDMKHLNDLSIGGNFTEKGLQHLKELKSLQFLYLFPDYAIPNRAIRELKKSLPILWFFQMNTK
jgi:Leucine-rich repeat (LRR) protein